MSRGFKIALLVWLVATGLALTHTARSGDRTQNSTTTTTERSSPGTAARSVGRTVDTERRAVQSTRQRAERARDMIAAAASIAWFQAVAANEPEPVDPPVESPEPGPPVVAVAIHATGQVNGYACGGDLPPCHVLSRESGGDPRVWNGGCYAPVGFTGARSPCGVSSASGLWQFIRGTWDGFGGYVNAADAPAEVQNEKARLTWDGGNGCSHWSAC